MSDSITGLRGAVPAEEACRQVVEGEECYGAVRWAMESGIWEHPEWYPDLTPDSPMGAFQEHLYSISHASCPRPCNTGSMPLTTAAPAEACRRAVEGEECYEHVMWAMQHGITSNPEGYPGLTPGSSFEEFQAHLHNIDHGPCPEPCPSVPPAPVCRLQIMYYVKVCRPFARCGFAGRYLEAGRCLEPTSWNAGHYARVNLQQGSTTCADSATAKVEYFTSNGGCGGTPDSSMVIATNGTGLMDGCRDIYGHLWTNYTCSAGWV